ncbi:sensor histidine kinase [Spirosoma harenae]
MREVNDRWIRVVGIGLLWLRDSYTNKVFILTPSLVTLKHAIELLILTTLTWELNRWILLWFQRRYPLLSQTRRRILTALPICWLVCLLIDCADMALVNYTNYHVKYSTNSFLNAIPGALLFSGLIIGIQEAVFHFHRLIQSERQAEALKKEFLQTQLDSLKQQVNPHFLFNSLNTLSYLIEDDSERAELFLNELCKVYRYLLRANEHDLAELSTEIQFIRSYYHLLKTRYGDSLHLTIAVDPSYQTYLLPSLTLQLLLENAVKHNVIDKTQPLRVVISTGPEGMLTVTNNLQKKPHQLPSTQVGLRNIATKFQLLGQGDVQIQETTDQFVVRFPLIAADQVFAHSQPA